MTRIFLILLTSIYVAVIEVRQRSVEFSLFCMILVLMTFHSFSAVIYNSTCPASSHPIRPHSTSPHPTSQHPCPTPPCPASSCWTDSNSACATTSSSPCSTGTSQTWRTASTPTSPTDPCREADGRSTRIPSRET